MLAIVLGGCSADSVSACRRSPIIEGTPDDGDPSVVMLAFDGEFWCSGSIIAPGAVLTARHCVEDEYTYELMDAARMDIRTGAQFDGAPQLASVREIVTTEGDELDGADIAVVVLDRAVDLAPYPWQREGTLADGTMLTGIGYGLTRRPGPYEEPVRKHRGVSTIESSTTAEFTTTTPITCYGDSGGPALDQNGRIIGVVSRGTDDNCAVASIYTRTDAFADLIDGALERAPMPTPAPMPSQPDAGPSTQDGSTHPTPTPTPTPTPMPTTPAPSATDAGTPTSC